MKDRCCVADDRCEAPANLEDEDMPTLRTKCFVCGLPVCKKCSSIIKWYHWGKRRVCNNCKELPHPI